MKTLTTTVAMLGIVALTSVQALALEGPGIIVDTNMMGYKGTVWNETDGTGPWSTNEPRLGSIFVSLNGQGDQYNILLSSWWEHSPSNQNDSFLQIYEDDIADGTDNPISLDSYSAGWNAAKTEFVLTATGGSSPYPWSRFWQPDEGHAWAVDFLEYTYEFTFSYSTAATEGPDGVVHTGLPDSIVGNFSGRFQSMMDLDKNWIDDGDIYGFDIDFDSQWFTTDGGRYGEITPSATVGTVPVPVPGAAVAGLGLLSLLGLRRRR